MYVQRRGAPEICNPRAARERWTCARTRNSTLSTVWSHFGPVGHFGVGRCKPYSTAEWDDLAMENFVESFEVGTPTKQWVAVLILIFVSFVVDCNLRYCGCDSGVCDDVGGI